MRGGEVFAPSLSKTLTGGVTKIRYTGRKTSEMLLFIVANGRSYIRAVPATNRAIYTEIRAIIGENLVLQASSCFWVSRLISVLEMVPPAQMFKNRLQEYAQKNSLPLPLYEVVNEGQDHLPQFKCTVIINGAKYESLPGFTNKKASQNAAAKAAVEDLESQGLIVEFKEKMRPKGILAEVVTRKNMPPPSYRFTRTYTATVVVNGVSYTGGLSNNQRDAQNKAALEALQAIDPKAAFEVLQANDPQYCNSLSHVEVNAKNDSKQPTAQPDNLASDNQLLEGTESQSAGNGLENSIVDGAPAPEKDSEKTDVENACAVGHGIEKTKVKDAHEAGRGMPDINYAHSVSAAQPHNHIQQDPLSAQQEHLKKETRDTYQDKVHGSKGMQQISQELDLTESISKRSRSESEIAEQISQKNKKNRKETDSTA